MGSARVLTALVALAAWWWSSLSSPADALLSSLQETLQGVARPPLRIAVGYNANLDLVVQAVPLLEQLMRNHEYDMSQLKPLDKQRVDCVADLVSLFGHWFSNGAAVERFIASAALFDELTHLALATQAGTLLGGNAGLMGNNLAAQGHKVLLGGVQSQAIGKLLHPAVQLVGTDDGNKDATGKTDHAEDTGLYHLILEYQKGAKFGYMVAPRANRMIIVRDLANAGLVSLESFHAALPSFDPEAVIVSGLHLLVCMFSMPWKHTA